MNRPTFGFEAHRPERRRRAGTTLHAGCCCCCCCLHSVGSLLGAVIAPSFGSSEPPITLPPGVDDRASPRPPETGIKAIESAIQSARPEPIRLEADEDRPPIVYDAGVTAVSLFWMFLFALSVVCAIWISMAGGGDACGGALLVLAMTLPAFQLASIVLVAVVLCFWPRPDRGYQFAQLGRITLGSFVGTVAGILVMILIGVLMSLR